MRNVFKVLALILIMSVILRDAKGARMKAFRSGRCGSTTATAGSCGQNLTDLSGVVNC